MRRVEKKIEVGGESVTVKELTVAEYRALLEIEAETDMLRALLIDGFTFRELQTMTDLTDEQIEQFTPSMLSEVVEHCKEVHGSFFLMLKRAAEINALIDAKSQEILSTA